MEAVLKVVMSLYRNKFYYKDIVVLYTYVRYDAVSYMGLDF